MVKTVKPRVCRLHASRPAGPAAAHLGIAADRVPGAQRPGALAALAALTHLTAACLDVVA